VLAASASDIPAAPVVAAMAIGVLIAIYGHAARNYRIVGVGLTILFLATAAMVLVGFTAYDQDPNDPRPCAIQAAC
jgi:peptidoglycan/LPS O-acetylase OafA/YrhL